MRLLCFCAVVTPCLAAPPPLSLGERARLYAVATVGPGSLLSSAASSAINQWRDAPTEWGQGAAGYGHRFGTSLAGNAAGNAIEFGVSALRHEDTRYVRSRETGFWRRARDIIVHTYMVRKDGGGTTFAVSRLVGGYGSAFLANTWVPARVSNTQEALLRGTWSLAGDMGNSAFREFWPDIKRRLFHKR